MNFTELGTTWYGGKGAMKVMFEKAPSTHTFFVASDYYDDVKKFKSKVYASYKSSSAWWHNTKDVASDSKSFYAIVPKGGECCLYADLEWSLDWKTAEEIKEKFISLVSSVLKEKEVKVESKDFFFSNACQTSTAKGSLHAHVPTVSFKNNDDQRKFFNVVWKFLHAEKKKWFFKERTEKSLIEKTFIDFGVHDSNRQIRLPYSSKMKGDGSLKRPLIPEPTARETEGACPKDVPSTNFDISNYTITDTDKSITPLNVDDFSNEIQSTKKNIWSLSLLEGLADAYGCSVDKIHSDKLASLRNKRGVPRKCIISGGEHESNNAFITTDENKVFFHCHSEDCRGRKVCIYTRREESKYKYAKPPFDIWRTEFLKHKKKWESPETDEETVHREINHFQAQFIADINQYVKCITGSDRVYYLYRNIHTHNPLGRKAKGRKVVVWFGKLQNNFIEVFQNYDCVVKRKNEKIEVCGVKVYCKSIHREEYDQEDCRPYENEEDCPSHIFNTYEGLSITRELAYEFGKSDITPLLNFIRKAWCGGNEALFNWVMDWYAHSIQKPWKKMKTSIVLKGKEGAGKGMINQIHAKVFGDTHFFQPTSQEDMFGQFNYLLKNRLFVFADEMTWGGDKKRSGILKKLLSEESVSINKKFAPQQSVSNCMNFVFSSNEEHVVPAGINARRYTMLDLGDDFFSLTRIQQKELYDFCPYSWAKFLYDRDISGFNPNQSYITEGLTDQKLLSMSPIQNFWINRLDTEYEGDKWVRQAILYGEYSYESKWTENSVAFWKQTYKLLGKLEIRRKTESGVTYKEVFLPDREKAVRRVNEYFNCEIV